MKILSDSKADHCLKWFETTALRHLEARRRTIKSILKLKGRECRNLKIGVKWTLFLVLVKMCI